MILIASTVCHAEAWLEPGGSIDVRVSAISGTTANVFQANLAPDVSSCRRDQMLPGPPRSVSQIPASSSRALRPTRWAIPPTMSRQARTGATCAESVVSSFCVSTTVPHGSRPRDRLRNSDGLVVSVAGVTATGISVCPRTNVSLRTIWRFTCGPPPALVCSQVHSDRRYGAGVLCADFPFRSTFGGSERDWVSARVSHGRQGPLLT
jgi:hypothetical protein